MELKEKSKSFQRRSIIWISFLILDIYLHKTSRIEILRHLAQRGYDVYLIAARSKKRYHIKSPKVHVISLPLRYVPLISPILFSLTVLLFLPFYIVKKRPSFIITEPSTPVFGFLWKPVLAQFMRFKVILDIRSTPVNTFGLRAYLQRLQFNISVHVAKKIFDGITIITSSMKKVVCKEFNVNPESVGEWSSAASLELFNCEKNISYGLELRRKFGLSNKFIVFYHGALRREGGVVESAKAINLIKKVYPDIALFLLGNGPAFRSLQNVIQENVIQDKVIMHQAVDYYDVPKFIAMCDVGIVPLPNLPIWRNQCFLKLLEYLAMKKPVIVTNIDANREIVGEKKCGIYASSSDPNEIARAMVFAYSSKKKLKEWGALGRKIVIQKYNWDKAAKDLENYLLKVENGLVEW